MIINDFTHKKVYDYLKVRQNGRALFIFNHGLGDFINFLPLLKHLKNIFPNWIFKLGCGGDRNVSSIIPDCILLSHDIRMLLSQYTYIFRLGYPEPNIVERKMGKIKPYLCNEKEMGLPDFKWEPYKLNVSLNNEKSNMVGVHFTGNTNPKLKNINFIKMEMIWRELKSQGFFPFEVHMNNSNTMDLNFPSFINAENSLRFQKPNLNLMINTISKCKYFIGIDSGPLYLAGSILGYDNVIGLENRIRIRWYLPYNIPIIDTNNYVKNDIKNIFNNL